MNRHRPCRRSIILALACLSCVTAPAFIQAQTTQPAPASQPATPEAQALPTDASGWLDRIDAAGKQLKSLQGVLRYEVVQGAMGDKQVRMGSLFYDAAPPAKFAVHFDRLLAGRRLIREDRWYLFDGYWLVEKMVDQKQFIKRELVKPKPATEEASTPGDPASVDASIAVNPLADGTGPFALPITLNKQAVLRKHAVTLIAAADKDPAGSVHLRFTPHVARRGEFTRIDLWYDTTTLLPVRVETLDETENETTVILSSVQVDQPIPSQVFDTTPPAQADGWTVELKPLDE